MYSCSPSKGFLKADISLSKLNSLQEVFEEHAFALCDSSNLCQLVLFILQHEISQLKEEMAGKNVGI